MHQHSGTTTQRPQVSSVQEKSRVQYISILVLYKDFRLVQSMECCTFNATQYCCDGAVVACARLKTHEGVMGLGAASCGYFLFCFRIRPFIILLQYAASTSSAKVGYANSTGPNPTKVSCGSGCADAAIIAAGWTAFDQLVGHTVSLYN